jgi:hypothetical protein
MPAKYRSWNNVYLKSAARSVLRICKTLSPTINNELYVQGVLWGYLEGLVGPVDHEYRMGGKLGNKRIDFRKRSPHPSVLELVTILTGKAAKGKKWGQEHRAYRNVSELRKLASISTKRARRRILMILDFHNAQAIKIDRLGPDYRQKWKQLRTTRRLLYGVSVLYAHPKEQYWVHLKATDRPYRKA